MLFTAARTLGQTGQVHAAITAYEDLDTRTFHHHGPDHSGTLEARHQLSRWRGEAGDVAGAATALAELLTDRQRIQGPDTLTTLRNLAYWRGEADRRGSDAGR
ncbi:hypothetical protein [Actinocorallia herbida]|uniref:hypothetical protein n=1 Tax=Actinocorallia herbida TaxID=58109 RepID=UPI000F4CF144|nr:hypothetical protein [Actinocorallia herbida]